MSQVLINQYLAQLDVLKKVGGTHRKSVVREAFKDLLKGDDSDFHRKNNVAHELYVLEETFFTGSVKRDTLKGLEPYYAAIRTAAAQIGNHHEKQTFLKVIYENFYKVYNAKAADRLGVVYTPNEIVRFMIDGADWLCETHFSKSLIDRDVEILDPATGTGTYICELLERFRGQDKKLERKYREELHANEVAILPYYVANLNIEATYAAITGRYEEFANLCFVDTLDNVGLHTQAHGSTADLFGSVSDENVARIKRQNARKISVIIGNPPYNANQANENDNNKNREYPSIDARIKQTYIAESTAQKTKLYDMYARFFRWSSDRLDTNGIIAFVSNSSFIHARTFDGFRKVLAREFHEIRIVDLKGNARTSGERRRQEGGNIFDDQIRVVVAVWFCVKKKGAHGCRILYEAVRDYAKADEKREFLAAKTLRERPFEEIRPDAKGNWLDLTNTFNEHCTAFNEMLVAFKTKSDKATLSVEVTRLEGDVQVNERQRRRLSSAVTCEEYRKAKALDPELELLIRAAEEALTKEQSAYLSAFFDRINYYFTQFGSKHFAIATEEKMDMLGYQPVLSLVVKYHGVVVEPQLLGSVFSESDRRALALSIFWAKLSILTGAERALTIAVLDDPVTSFDDKRVSTSVMLMRYEATSLRQLVLFTHYHAFARRWLEVERASGALSFHQLTRDDKTTTLTDADPDDFLQSEQEKLYRKFIAFIDGKISDAIGGDLRVYFESEIRERYRQHLATGSMQAAQLSDAISFLAQTGAISAAVAIKAHHYREDLNLPHHLLTARGREDWASLAYCLTLSTPNSEHRGA